MSKRALILFLIIIAIGVIFFLYDKQNEYKAPKSSNEHVFVSQLVQYPNPTSWKSFVSSKYNYSFNYPNDPADTYRLNASDGNYDWGERDLETAPIISILSGQDFNPPPLLNVVTEGSQSGSDLYLFSIGSATSIQNWVEKVREINLNDKKPNSSDKQIGELTKITIAGRTGYMFTLTKSFSYGDKGGYVLDTSHNYIFFDNQAGSKFLIYYPTSNKLSEKILQSFKFVK